MHRERVQQTRKGALLEAMDTALSVIGETARERLEWLIRATERHPKDMLPGDWDNLQLGLAAFSVLNPAVRKLGWGGMTAVAGEVDKPSKEEARKILASLEDIISQVVQRKDLPSERLEITESVFWHKPKRRYISWKLASKADLDLLARVALRQLITECGHLVKQCPAPAAHGEEGEICGRRFVARRPNQDYCSHRCQSRSAMREIRRGQKDKKDRKKKG